MEEILNNWLQEKPKDKFDKELHKYTYYDLMDFSEHYHTLQLQQPSASDSLLKINVMKKYTVIYSEYFQTGSHQYSIAKKKHIECFKEKLNETVDNEIGWSNVWFILDGHCETTSD